MPNSWVIRVLYCWPYSLCQKMGSNVYCTNKTCLKHLWNQQIYSQYALTMDLLCDDITFDPVLDFFWAIGNNFSFFDHQAVFVRHKSKKSLEDINRNHRRPILLLFLSVTCTHPCLKQQRIKKNCKWLTLLLVSLMIRKMFDKLLFRTTMFARCRLEWHFGKLSFNPSLYANYLIRQFFANAALRAGSRKQDRGARIQSGG